MTVQTSGRKRLTPKQQRFVDELLKDPDRNRTQAAIRAGYAAKSAKVKACQMPPQVEAAIARGDAARARRVEVKQDDVLRELMRVGLADIGQAFDENGRLRRLHEMPEDMRRAISAVEVEDLYEGHGEDRERVGDLVKVKFWNKPEALDKLMRHLGAYKDTLKLTGGVLGVTLEQLVPKRAQPPVKGAG